MGTRRIALGGVSAIALALALLLAPASAQSGSSPCPPGQPTGRPPGQPPAAAPGQPAGRPPQYPPGQCQASVSRNSLAPGDSLQISGSGYDRNSGVNIQLFGKQGGQTLGDGAVLATTGVRLARFVGAELAQAQSGQSLGQASADGNGQFSKVVTIPTDTQPGRYAITATGYRNGAPYQLSADLTVTGAAAAGAANRGTLPRTGAFIAGLAALGAALTGAGTVAVLAARRRRAGQPA